MKKTKNIHDKLIKRSKKGDPQAQFELYNLYYKAMYNTSLRILNNSAEAEDAMQEAFLAAFQKLDTYREEVSFGFWLKRIVVNKSIDMLKKKKADWIALDDNIQIEEEDEAPVKEEGLQVEKIKEAIQQLNKGYRIVLTLYLIEGYDHEEIGSILNISSSTSRSQFTRAKKKLIETLNSMNP